jgi:hypothetical protein
LILDSIRSFGNGRLRAADRAVCGARWPFVDDFLPVRTLSNFADLAPV